MWWLRRRLVSGGWCGAFAVGSGTGVGSPRSGRSAWKRRRAVALTFASSGVHVETRKARELRRKLVRLYFEFGGWATLMFLAVVFAWVPWLVE